MSNLDDGYVPEKIEIVPEQVDVVETEYVTRGRVDPTYQVTTQQYEAPVAETRSFLSRFWWIIPLLVLLIALPFILNSCHREEACATLPGNVWTEALQAETWAEVEGIFPTQGREVALNGLAELCNRRLSGTAISTTDVIDLLSIEPGPAETVLRLVNGDNFCRCN